MGRLFLSKTRASLVFLMFLMNLPQAHAKRWLLGLSGIGGLYSQNQDDWNSLITSNEGASAQQFNKKAQLYWGGQLDFIHLDFAGRFMLGIRYEQLSEKAGSTTSSSENKAHLITFSDTFYFFPIQNGVNMFMRLGLGFITAKGSYTINATSSTLSFKGNYFTGFATGGFEFLFWHFAISVEAGYRYAVIPKATITSATGTSFSGGGYATGSTLMINTGGGHKFKVNYTGVFYGAMVKLYF